MSASWAIADLIRLVHNPTPIRGSYRDNTISECQVPGRGPHSFLLGTVASRITHFIPQAIGNIRPVRSVLTQFCCDIRRVAYAHEIAVIANPTTNHQGLTDIYSRAVLHNPAAILDRRKLAGNLRVHDIINHPFNFKGSL